jgi:hypothetical protein
MHAARVADATSCSTTQTKRSASKRLGVIVVSLIAAAAGGGRERRAGAARGRRLAVEEAAVVRRAGRAGPLPVVALGAVARGPALRRAIAGEKRGDRLGERLRAAARRPRGRSDRRPSSASPSLRRTTIGVPQAIASSAERPKVSWSPAWTKASAPARIAASAATSATNGTMRTRALGRRRRRSGADRQQHVRRAEPGHRGGEHVEVLLGREAAGVDEHLGVGGEAEPVAPLRSMRRARMEGARVDAERLPGDALDAPFAEMVAHAAARREHEVEAAIEVRA